MDNPNLLLSMVVRNEEHRYLKKVLEAAIEYVDYVIIIDDNSVDNTVKISENILKNIPHKIILNTKSNFSNEVILRKMQWEETIKLSPKWILNLDADEIFEDSFKDNIKELLNTSHEVIYFRLYDMWSETHYRDDDFWKAHNYYRPFLVRYNKDFNYTFNDTPQHCGRFPSNISSLSYFCSNLRLKHYGWSKKVDREEKFKRYMKLDPNGTYGWLAQYHSILDPNPNLVKWEE